MKNNITQEKMQQNLVFRHKIHVLINNPGEETYHSIENLILHLKQPFSERLHVYEPIETTKTLILY